MSQKKEGGSIRATATFRRSENQLVVWKSVKFKKSLKLSSTVKKEAGGGPLQAQKGESKRGPTPSAAE